MQSDWKFVHGRYFWRVKYTQKDVVEFSTFSIIPDLPSRPAIYMSMCHPLVIPTWFSLLGFTWNSIPGEARCGVFLRNRVTYRDHLPLDIFGGWHLSISPKIHIKNSGHRINSDRYSYLIWSDHNWVLAHISFRIHHWTDWICYFDRNKNG